MSDETSPQYNKAMKYTSVERVREIVCMHNIHNGR